MDWLPLSLFPEGALASSVVTTVWIGVFFVAFFNLRFGWPLSGLVVPGYLVPLLLIKPLSAAVVLIEGMVTYSLVWFYSEYLSRRLGWSNFFGRDRFFALVLTAVAVRLAMDGWLLPAFGEWFNATFRLAFDYRNHLHSFGLIIVSLIANNFWKTGFRHGLAPMLTTIGLTYLAVRYGLMELTNFNINSLGYAYEDVAASILASPKAYIILLTTAFIASRMNLLYGWDFAGILIPSLLALQWFQPGKIVASLVEAAIVLVLADAAGRLPLFRGLSMEGARKLLLFFNVSFLYKFVLAYLLLWLAPTERISDYYGFGYLLPTLIAIKMHDKGIFARMTRATLQTSIVSATLATLIGFAISLLPEPSPEPRAGAADGGPLRSSTQALADLVRAEKIGLHRTRLADAMTPPLAADLEHFRRGVEALLDYRDRRQAADLDAARGHLAGANYEVLDVEGRYLVLREREPRHHWGLYALAREPRNPLTVEVPAPLDEPGSADVGLWLFRLMDGRALAIAGAARRANREGSSDVLSTPRSLFQVFHQAVARRDVLQVRGHTEESARAAGVRRQQADAGDPVEAASGLWVKRELPRGLDMRVLASLAPGFRLNWHAAPAPNLQQDTLRTGFSVLVLNRSDTRNFLSRVLAADSEVRVTSEQRSIEGYLQDWLLADRRRIAAGGSDSYQRPTIEDLLFFDGEVVTPLLALSREEYRDRGWTQAGIDGLRVIQEAAGVVGYEVVRYRHQGTGNDYLILAERDREPRRYWGTYVFRLGPARPFAIQVPRPVFEVNSFEFGVALFESIQARALLIGGAHPHANRDFSSDIIRLQFKENAFNVVSQALLRDWADTPAAIIQSRATAIRRGMPSPTADLVLATADGTASAGQLSPIGREFWQQLQRFGVSVAFSGGDLATAGYEAGGLPQALYLPASRHKEFFIAWTSPLVRAAYRQQTEPTGQQNQVAALGIPSRDGDLVRELAGLGLSDQNLSADSRQLLRRYFASQDIVLLQELLRRHPRWHFERLVDLNSRQGFLLVVDENRRLLAVANLNARESAGEARFDPAAPAAAIAAFVDSRAALLTGSPD